MKNCVPSPGMSTQESRKRKWGRVNGLRRKKYNGNPQPDTSHICPYCRLDLPAHVKKVREHLNDCMHVHPPALCRAMVDEADDIFIDDASSGEEAEPNGGMEDVHAWIDELVISFPIIIITVLTNFTNY